MSRCDLEFIPLKLAVLTLNDRRSKDEDSSGDYLAAALQSAGHQLQQRTLLPNDRYAIRALVSQWIFDQEIQGILINGGTGFFLHNQTPETITPLFDRPIEGFGELFRQLSFQELGSGAIQSRALAGIANRTVIFCLPGSTEACRLGWEQLIRPQLDGTTRPCNFVTHVQ